MTVLIILKIEKIVLKTIQSNEIKAPEIDTENFSVKCLQTDEIVIDTLETL